MFLNCFFCIINSIETRITVESCLKMIRITTGPSFEPLRQSLFEHSWMVSEYCLLFSTGCTCHLHDWVSLKIKNNSKLSPFHWLIMMFLIKMPIFWGFNNGLIPYVNTWWVSICPITSTENIPMIQSPEIPHGFRVPPLKSAWRQKNLPIIKSVNKYVKVAFTNQKKPRFSPTKSTKKTPILVHEKNPFQPWGSNLEGLTSGCTWSAWEASHGTALCGAGWAERLTLPPDANSNINMVYIYMVYIWFMYIWFIYRYMVYTYIYIYGLYNYIWFIYELYGLYMVYIYIYMIYIWFIYCLYIWFIYMVYIYGLYIWFIYGLYMVYIWFIYGLYMVYIWFIYALYMLYICFIYMVYIWFMYGLYMVYIYMVYIWFIYYIWLIWVIWCLTIWWWISMMLVSTTKNWRWHLTWSASFKGHYLCMCMYIYIYIYIYIYTLREHHFWTNGK